MKSHTLHYTTLPYNTTIDSILYDADNGLAGVDPPKLSDTVDREAFKIKFADPSLEFAGVAKELINTRVAILAGFYNTTGEYLQTSTGAMAAPNEALLNLQDTLTIYRGFIDSVRYTMSEENGTLLELECTSPMASLDALNSFYTTTNSIKQRVDAGTWSATPDTCFDNVSLGGKSQEILWGKV